jgi:hypothetical protein
LSILEFLQKCLKDLTAQTFLGCFLDVYEACSIFFPHLPGFHNKASNPNFAADYIQTRQSFSSQKFSKSNYKYHVETLLYIVVKI